jgi:hypothetical protein
VSWKYSFQLRRLNFLHRRNGKVSITGPRNLVLAAVAIGFQFNLALAADYDLVYAGKWRNSDDVVNGWDWTLPAGVMPAPGSGIFNLNSSVPPDFPGHHLKQIDAKWSELEPREGKYDLSSILDQLDDPAYDGAMLNVRGMVVAIEDANGNPAFQRGVTAPKWLSDTVPKTQEGLKNGARVTNMHIYDPRVKLRLIRLIHEIGKSDIPSHPKLKAQIIHGVSSSRGEEWTGKQASRAEAVLAMEEIIGAWTLAYGRYAKKLAWLKEDPENLFNASVVTAGTGIRGGAIEKWLRNAYTPGNVRRTGQLLDAGGYLSTDERFAPIAEGRHFQDQNEAYRIGHHSPPTKWAQNYRMANLRMLQMRRNIAWTETNSTINPQMLNWMSLELGQSASSSPDAWVALIRTWARHGNENREINNIERWLHQRERKGAATSPKLKMSHGFNAAGTDLLPSNLWTVDLARSAPLVGIAVNDKFLSGGPHAVAVKVTYFDSATEQWSLVYNKNGGGIGSRTIKGGATGKVRTATFFIDDFAAPERGYDFDFRLESGGGNTPYMFVRLIKLDLDRYQVSAPPSPPEDVQVLH